MVWDSVLISLDDDLDHDLKKGCDRFLTFKMLLLFLCTNIYIFLAVVRNKFGLKILMRFSFHSLQASWSAVFDRFFLPLVLTSHWLEHSQTVRQFTLIENVAGIGYLFLTF
jgi:hypothetical protein